MALRPSSREGIGLLLLNEAVHINRYLSIRLPLLCVSDSSTLSQKLTILQPEAPFTQPEWQRLILAYGDWFLGRYEALEGLLVSTEKTIRRRVVGYTAEERRVMELLTPVGVI